MTTTENIFSAQILNAGEHNETLILRNARLIFKNFSGAKTDYNREGDRNFSVIIDDPNVAYELMDHSWNIREKPPKIEGGETMFTLKVNVRFDQKFPPQIWMIKGQKKILLDASNVSILDISRIEKAMVSIRAYKYSRNGQEGISAYLNEIYAHVEAGIFDDEYANYITDTSSVTAQDVQLPF